MYDKLREQLKIEKLLPRLKHGMSRIPTERDARTTQFDDVVREMF